MTREEQLEAIARLLGKYPTTIDPRIAYTHAPVHPRELADLILLLLEGKQEEVH